MIRITIIYHTPTVGQPGGNFSFTIYESDSNLWKEKIAPQHYPAPLAKKKNIPIYPGATTFEVSIPINDLQKLYISGQGEILNTDGQESSIFVAEPPDGHVEDVEAFQYGAPWISLTELSSTNGLSADLFIVYGKDCESKSYHPAYVVGAWAVNLSNGDQSA